MVVANSSSAEILASDPRVANVTILPSHSISSPPPATPTRPATVVNEQRPARVAANANDLQFGPYAYDDSGHITEIGTNQDQFRYDAFGRLKTSTVSGVAQEFTYDVYGNLDSVKTNGTTATIGIDSATNRLKSTGSYNVFGQYDAAGRMTSYVGRDIFWYDALDMMKESVVQNQRKVYLYTASDERLASITISGATETTSSWTVRDTGGQVLRAYNKSMTGGERWWWTEDYIYRDGKLVAAEVDTPTKTLHFHPDHLGTPRLITGNGGATVARHDYQPFGSEITAANQDSERMRFTEHERDFAGGITSDPLDYMHARYYSPSAGRFLSADPGRDWDPSQPQSWNLYVYTRNNPVTFFDPDGAKARLYTYIGFTNPGAKSELPTANVIKNQLKTELGSRIVNQRIQMNPNASPSDFRTGLTDSEGISLFIGHAFTPGPGLKFDDAHSDWLQNVTSNNTLVLLGSCDSAGYAKLFGINSSSTGQAFVGFAGQVNSMVLAEMTTMIVTLMEQGKSVGDAVAAVRAELADRGVDPSDFRVVLIGDPHVKVNEDDFKTDPPGK